ncbi:hypothetical protein EG834_08945, partial [bacterium]|nr:hypothetical protein [bacterium]
MNNLTNNLSDENEETTKKRSLTLPLDDADSNDVSLPNDKAADPVFTMQLDATQAVSDVEDLPTINVETTSDAKDETSSDALGAPPPGASDALPNHVDETDMGATMVIPTAFAQSMTPPDLPDQPV